MTQQGNDSEKKNRKPFHGFGTIMIDLSEAEKNAGLTMGCPGTVNAEGMRIEENETTHGTQAEEDQENGNRQHEG